MINHKKLFPVIHVRDEKTTFKNVEICIKSNVDGVFLISHSILKYKELIELGKKIKNKFPDLWIGYNFLDIEKKELFSKMTNLLNSKDFEFNPDGLWLDDTLQGINIKKKYADKIVSDWKNYKENGFKGLYFGGVAFKYCEQPLNLKEASKNSVNNMDIITTSGNGTGQSADINKIKTMYEGINNKSSLAIASGITIENVNDYLPYIDYFLVSTGISIDDYNFNEFKVLELSKIIHEYYN